MKKLLFVLLCSTVIVASCNQTNEVKSINGNTNTEEQIQKQQASKIVIVKVSHGKKKGKWPNQRCVGDETFRCWRWFPKDELIENEEIFMTENYMIMEYSNLNPSTTPVVLRIPKTHEYTNQEMDLYNYVKENGGFAVYEPIIVDEPSALEYLNVPSPLMVVPKFYRAIQQEYSILLPIELTIYNE
ncbi:MAG: hypothetical protein PUC14_05055 [Bacteroidales bacterium]|nr:hypothetical protein [Bacteroidales bacterium]